MVRTSEPEPQDAAQTGSERVQAWSPLQSDALEDGFVSLGSAAATAIAHLSIKMRERRQALDAGRAPATSDIVAIPVGKGSMKSDGGGLVGAERLFSRGKITKEVGRSIL